MKCTPLYCYSGAHGRVLAGARFGNDLPPSPAVTTDDTELRRPSAPVQGSRAASSIGYRKKRFRDISGNP